MVTVVNGLFLKKHSIQRDRFDGVIPYPHIPNVAEVAAI